jgi:hypothetical protein
MPLVEFHHSSVYRRQIRYRLIGSAIPLRRLSGLEVFPVLVPSVRCRKTTDSRPPLSLQSPSESSRNRPPQGLRPSATLLGFRPPSATSVLEARSSRSCLLRHLPTSGFLTLLPVSFFQYLPALFHAGAAHGVLPSGLFPLTEPLFPFGSSDLPDVGLRRRKNSSEPSFPSRRELRLQGFALCEDPSPQQMG